MRYILQTTWRRGQAIVCLFGQGTVNQVNSISGIPMLCKMRSRKIEKHIQHVVAAVPSHRRIAAVSHEHRPLPSKSSPMSHSQKSARSVEDACRHAPSLSHSMHSPLTSCQLPTPCTTPALLLPRLIGPIFPLNHCRLSSLRPSSFASRLFSILSASARKLANCTG